jgi:hypothetical protein
VDDNALHAFEVFAETMLRHAETLRKDTRNRVDETLRARNDVFTVLEPASKHVGASSLADAADAATKGCVKVTDEIIGLTTKVDGIVHVYKSAMDDVGRVSFELSLIGDKPELLTAADGAKLYGFRLSHRLAHAQWKIYSGAAILQLHSVLRDYHKVLLAFSGEKPGRKWSFAAAGKEIAEKARDTTEDFLIFPGYTKLKKILRALRTSPATKEAQELLRAEGMSRKVDVLNHGLERLGLLVEYAAATIKECGKGLLDASDAFDRCSGELLASLSKDRDNSVGGKPS